MNDNCNGFVDCLPFTNNVIDNGLRFYCSLIIYIQLHFFSELSDYF